MIKKNIWLLISAVAFVSMTASAETMPGDIRCTSGYKVAKQQFGSGLDDVNDVAKGSPAYFDIYSVKLNSEAVKEEINFLLIIHGVFPEEGHIDASYRILFDADNDKQTGSAVQGFEGVEKEFRIDVSGNQAQAPLTVSGLIIDHLIQKEIRLPLAPTLEHKGMVDIGDPSIDEEHFLAHIPKNFLALVADQIPVTVIAEDKSGVADTASLIFDQKWYEKEPTLTLSSGTPGQLIDFTVKGLTSSTTFGLTVEDESVFTDKIKSDGSFMGSFRMPMVGLGKYFVTAQDSTGEFAFSVLDCK